DGVHGVEAQAVEVIFLEPIERVVNEEVAHQLAPLAIEIKRSAPGRVVPLIEEGWRVAAQEVTFRSKMVVDDIEQYHEAARVGGIDQTFERLRTTVGGIGRKGQHTVVAPVAITGKLGDGHELDGGDAERTQVVEAAFNAGVAPLV